MPGFLVYFVRHVVHQVKEVRIVNIDLLRRDTDDQTCINIRVSITPLWALVTS